MVFWTFWRFGRSHEQGVPSQPQRPATTPTEPEPPEPEPELPGTGQGGFQAGRVEVAGDAARGAFQHRISQANLPKPRQPWQRPHGRGKEV